MATLTRKTRPVKLTAKTERNLLKVALLCLIQNFLQEMTPHSPPKHTKKAETMDNPLLQTLITAIVESGEYTLEGIAYYARIPLDALLDAISGTHSSLSIKPWTRIAALFLHARPDIADIIINRLLHSLKTGRLVLTEILDEGG